MIHLLSLVSDGIRCYQPLTLLTQRSQPTLFEEEEKHYSLSLLLWAPKCAVLMWKTLQTHKGLLVPDPTLCTATPEGKLGCLEQTQRLHQTEALTIELHSLIEETFYFVVPSSVRLLKKTQKEMKVFYHGERCCSLFQQSHQTSFCEILSRADTFFIWWYNIIRNSWLFQNIGRYVLRRYNIEKIVLLTVSNIQHFQYLQNQLIFNRVWTFLEAVFICICLISFWTSTVLQHMLKLTGPVHLKTLKAKYVLVRSAQYWPAYDY